MVEYQSPIKSISINCPNDNPCSHLAEVGWIGDTPFSLCYADDTLCIHDVVIFITAHNECIGGKLEGLIEGLRRVFNASTDIYERRDRKSVK